MAERDEGVGRVGGELGGDDVDHGGRDAVVCGEEAVVHFGPACERGGDAGGGVVAEPEL